MGRPKRQYPLGKYRLRTPKEVDKEKAYPVELEYTWNRQVIRKTTNVFVKVADWNPETSAKPRLIFGLIEIKLKKSLKRHKSVENAVCQGFPYPCFPLI